MDYPEIKKIVKLEDGSRAKLTCILVNWGEDRKFAYRIDCHIAKPRKRTFKHVVDSDDYAYRALNLEDREKQRSKAILEAVGIGECEAIANELWRSLKPHNIEIKAR